MDADQEKTKGTDATAAGGRDTRDITIDLAAPAGSEGALGAESVRDGRPASRDDVVEAIDEEGPGVTVPLAKEEAAAGN
ncbi:MAG: hypothetical protein ABR910_02375 [Acidobacteriaceae bacterium]|jgi:hypothetical protein